MDSKKIIHIALQIEKSHADRTYGTILTLLSDLDKLHLSPDQLETTDIVKVLYKLLKSSSDSSVKKTAKGLLAKWKRQYGNDRSVKCKEEEKDTKEVDGGVSQQQEPSLEFKDGRQGQFLKSQPCSSSSVRSKCVQLLLSALSPALPDENQASHIAEDIEKTVHKLHQSSELKYKACIRSKLANLKNPKNTHLLRGLSEGALSPEDFARMSVEEMASAELRQLREELSSRGVNERQLPQGIEGTPTQKIRCKRCGGSDCKVTQVSRGALFLPAWVRQSGPDHDAMTFVTCSGCGQQWYHSGWVCL